MVQTDWWKVNVVPIYRKGKRSSVMGPILNFVFINTVELTRQKLASTGPRY